MANSKREDFTDPKSSTGTQRCDQTVLTEARSKFDLFLRDALLSIRVVVRDTTALLGDDFFRETPVEVTWLEDDLASAPSRVGRINGRVGAYQHAIHPVRARDVTTTNLCAGIRRVRSRHLHSGYEFLNAVAEPLVLLTVEDTFQKASGLLLLPARQVRQVDLGDVSRSDGRDRLFAVDAQEPLTHVGVVVRRTCVPPATFGFHPLIEGFTKGGRRRCLASMLRNPVAQFLRCAVFGFLAGVPSAGALRLARDGIAVVDRPGLASVTGRVQRCSTVEDGDARSPCAACHLTLPYWTILLHQPTRERRNGAISGLRRWKNRNHMSSGSMCSGVPL